MVSYQYILTYLSDHLVLQFKTNWCCWVLSSWKRPNWTTLKRWALLSQKCKIEAIKSCSYNQRAHPLAALITVLRRKEGKRGSLTCQRDAKTSPSPIRVLCSQSYTEERIFQISPPSLLSPNSLSLLLHLQPVRLSHHCDCLSASALLFCRNNDARRFKSNFCKYQQRLPLSLYSDPSIPILHFRAGFDICRRGATGSRSHQHQPSTCLYLRTFMLLGKSTVNLNYSVLKSIGMYLHRRAVWYKKAIRKEARLIMLSTSDRIGCWCWFRAIYSLFRAPSTSLCMSACAFMLYSCPHCG